MKHKVTVTVEEKRRFLGIPYTTTKKKRITVDGRTYRKMKDEERARQEKRNKELLACVEIWEEEMIDSINNEGDLYHG